MTNSMLPVEDLLNDDISCDTDSNSTYSSFWSIEAFRESHYSPIGVLILYVAAHLSPPFGMLILYLSTSFTAPL